ncbi:unnamed protein product [Owenia fusiformis]|uniref:Uncharacterized protein n=1 Tax=Owenia fusiformis TaxID=6347 RepID=A0A8J1TFK0_OWEFU|nr:unnamed protein product [Owenia fusiformis]
MSRKVLIAVDASQTAEQALDFYFANIHKDDNLVIIAHSPEQASLPAFTFREGLAVPHDEWTKIMQDQNKAQQDLEASYTQKVIQKKVNYKVVSQPNKGSPGEHIIKIAEDEGATMIVMGSRGLGKIRRTILGSVSDYVVHHTKIPVVIVPTRS